MSDKYYLTSICNLFSKLPPGCHMPSVGISVWTGLDPRGVTCRRDFNAQVSKNGVSSASNPSRIQTEIPTYDS